MPVYSRRHDVLERLKKGDFVPRIKRWFPCSQSINDDPDTWELTETFGDRSFRIWVQIMAELDRAQNRWRCTEEALKTIARKCRQSLATVSRAVGWMLAKGWLAIREISADGSWAILGAPNYADFRKIREPSWTPLGTLWVPLQTNKQTTASKKKPAPETAPPVDNSKKREMEDRIKAAIARVHEMAFTTISVARLISWRMDAKGEGYKDEAVLEALGRLATEFPKGKVKNWYGYLNSLLQPMQTGMLQAESAQHKRGDLTNAGEILRRLGYGT